MIRHISPCLLVAMSAFSLPATADDAYKLSTGPFVVQTADDITIQDRERPKEIHIKVYYPQGDGPFPVIVFSHGFAAGKDAFAPVGSHWASHGYVSVYPQHADGGSMDRSKRRKPNAGLDQEDDRRNNPAAGFDREQLRDRLKGGGLQAGGFRGMGGRLIKLPIEYET